MSMRACVVGLDRSGVEPGLRIGGSASTLVDEIATDVCTMFECGFAKSGTKTQPLPHPL